MSWLPDAYKSSFLLSSACFCHTCVSPVRFVFLSEKFVYSFMELCSGTYMRPAQSFRRRANCSFLQQFTLGFGNIIQFSEVWTIRGVMAFLSCHTSFWRLTSTISYGFSYGLMTKASRCHQGLAYRTLELDNYKYASLYNFGEICRVVVAAHLFRGDRCQDARLNKGSRHHLFLKFTGLNGSMVN